MGRLGALNASPLALGIGLFAASFVAQAVSVLSAQNESGEPIVWLSGGLLLAVLMSLPEGRGWMACLLGALIGVAAAGALVSMSFLMCTLGALAMLTLVPLAAHVLNTLLVDTSPLRVFRNLAWFVGIFIIVLPAVSAAVIVAVRYYSDQQQQTFMNWSSIALAHALGYLLFVPFWFKSIGLRSRWRRSGRPNAYAIVSALVAIVLIWFLWRSIGDVSYLRPLLLLAPVPILVFIALRARLLGTHIFMVLVAIVAVRLSMEGSGPFLEASALLTALSVKSWVLAMAVASCFLAVLVEQRAVMRRALVHSNREIRELAGRLIEAQEQERSRIARDLHDDVNQRLASASIELSVIRRTVDNRAQVELGLLQDELIALSEDVRHISHNLHPSMLHETGLRAAFSTLCGSQRHRNGPSIDLRVMSNADNLPDAVALCLYRAAQEALGNAVRHADAQHIEVKLRVSAGQAELIIRDDGKGFIVGGESAKPRGLGLLSLEERAKLLGGSFQLSASPGKGAHVCVRIPLQH